MNERHEEDVEIREALRKSLPSEEAPERLVRELRVMASQARTQNRRPWWRARLTLACAAAAAVLVVALTMTPAKASAKTFENLVVAAQKVNSFRFSIDSFEDGKRQRLTVAGVDGRFAMRTDEGAVVQIDSEAIKIYDPEENVVTRFKLGFVDMASITKHMQSGVAEGLKHADLKKMLRDYERQYGKEHIRISSIRRDGGEEVYDVELSAPKESERVRMKVDAATDLPLSIEAEVKGSDGIWRLESVMEMRFGDQIDPALLRADFPTGAKIVDIDLGELALDALKGLESVGSILEKIDGDDKKTVADLKARAAEAKERLKRHSGRSSVE